MMEPEKVLVDSAGGINLRKIPRVQCTSSFLSTGIIIRIKIQALWWNILHLPGWGVGPGCMARPCGRGGRYNLGFT